MAVSLDAGSDKVARSGSYITTTAAFTMCGWAKQGATTPSGGNFRNYYTYGDPAYTTAYVFVGSDPDANTFILKVWDGASNFATSSYTVTPGTYFHWAVRYNGTTSIDLIINGVIFETLTVTVSGITFATKTETIGAGGWSDFIFAGVGVYGAALTLHQIIVQSQAPMPRYHPVSFWPLCKWQTAISLLDFSGNGRNLTLTGSTTDEISPAVPYRLPYDTQFEDGFDEAWTDVTWGVSSLFPDASDYVKATQGCNFRNTYTSACRNSRITMFVMPVSPPDSPVDPAQVVTPAPDLLVAFTGAAFTLTGNVPDGTTSIDATLAPGAILLEITLPMDTVGTISAGPTSFLILQTGGSLSLSMAKASGFTNFISAPGAFPVDGLTRGVQVSLHYTSVDDVTFSVLVDNAVAITGSFNEVDHVAVDPSGLFGVGQISLDNSREVITTGYFTAFDRIRIVADSTLLPSWTGCTTATTLGPNAAAFCVLPDRTPPTPTTTTYPTVRERVFVLPFQTNLILFLERIEFLIQAGEGLVTGQGSDPVVAVWFSKDGGKTYGNGYTVRPGKMGEYDKRAYLNRLGRARNWVCKIRVSDPVFWAFLDCYVDMSEGTS